MDQSNCRHAESIINPSYLKLGENSLNKRDKILKQILTQRQLPAHPLDDLTIRYFLDSFALMDSNNFQGKVGVGQRQGRVWSRMVEERHFYLMHGIGRSGDIMANQPKAAGSSLMLQITRHLTVSALHQLNYQFVDDVLLLPLCTGMSLSLTFLTIAECNPDKKYVIMSRIDQKTCLKSIISANLTPIIVQLSQNNDFLHSNTQAIQQAIIDIGPQKVLCIVSTTSCFAPRIPDDTQANAQLAKKYSLFHVVNNAYGIWCSKIAHNLRIAMKSGGDTIVVQSTDKNFMVPVGGSIIFSNSSKMLDKISNKYPGRASNSPILDMFMTLLSMGKSTLQELKKQRKQNYQFMKKTAETFAIKHQCKIMQTPLNTISIAMSIPNFKIKTEEITELGAILYSKRVMGHRIIATSDKITKIGSHSFKNYGSHCQTYPYLPYITFACAVSTKKQQIEIFFKRLQQSVKQLVKKSKKRSQKQKQTQSKITTQDNHQQLQQVQKMQEKKEEIALDKNSLKQN